MYSAPLGQLLSRDPLATNGSPDVLYDNNSFGDRLTLIRNVYGYAGSNPLNRLDPSGLKCCGPDVTRWFQAEVVLFRARVANYWSEYEGTLASLRMGPRDDRREAAIGGYVLAEKARRLLLMRHLALKMDYKIRNFSSGGCPDGCPDTVTLAGRCLATNQLGNILYGIVAADLKLVEASRQYGRGNPEGYMKLAGATGPKPPWTAPGEAYRETAFDIGRTFAQTGEYYQLLDMNPAAPVTQGTAGCSPCNSEFSGPQTNLQGPIAPRIDPAGNVR